MSGGRQGRRRAEIRSDSLSAPPLPRHPTQNAPFARWEGPPLVWRAVRQVCQHVGPGLGNSRRRRLADQPCVLSRPVTDAQDELTRLSPHTEAEKQMRRFWKTVGLETREGTLLPSSPPSLASAPRELTRCRLRRQLRRPSGQAHAQNSRRYAAPRAQGALARRAVHRRRVGEPDHRPQASHAPHGALTRPPTESTLLLFLT